MRLKKYNEFDKINEVKLSKVVKKDNYEGYQIFIGRNAMMNDILSIEIADDNDIWLHASGVPGSHVVIRNPENEEVPKNVIQYAAEIAGKNSKAKGLTDVVVTKAKNVTKDPNMPAGKVKVNYRESDIYKVTV